MFRVEKPEGSNEAPFGLFHVYIFPNKHGGLLFPCYFSVSVKTAAGLARSFATFFTVSL